MSFLNWQHCDGVRDELRHAHSSYLKNVSAVKNGVSHRNPEDQGGFMMRLWVWYCEGHGWTDICVLGMQSPSPACS
jgi:hypothetical protein